MSSHAYEISKPALAGRAAAASERGEFVQRKCACSSVSGVNGDCEKCGKKRLQRQAGNPTQVRQPLSLVNEVLRSRGEPLDAEAQRYFESRLGHDFSRVRSHRIPNTPFGAFDLTTRSLTTNATNTWSMDNGNLGGAHDTVTMERRVVNVGNFVRSASNPTPATSLPASFTLTQSLFWFCRQAAAGSRWTRFIDVDHVRTLRLNGSDVEFVVTVNGFDNVDAYTGHPAIINARAAPATIPPTPRRTRRGPAPTPSTTTISADTLPDPLSGRHRVRFSIRGNGLGSRIDASSGLFTAGPNVGRVTVRASDVVSNPNFDEVVVTIANPTPQPAQPQPNPQPGQQPGQQPTQPPPGQPGQSPQGQQSGQAPLVQPTSASETTTGSLELERAAEK